MKQLILSMQAPAGLPGECCVKDAATQEIVYGTVSRQSWKRRIDVYAIAGSESNLSFSIKARDMLSWTYEVVDSQDTVIGFLDRDNAWSPLWRLVNAWCESIAPIERTSLSLCEEYRLMLSGQLASLFRKVGRFPGSDIYLDYLSESKLNSSLTLAIGLLLLEQGVRYGVVAAAG